MSEQIDFDEILARYRSDPYEYVDVRTAHTGRVSLQVQEGDAVVAPSGEWLQVPGTRLFEITRERNTKPVSAKTNGVVLSVESSLEGQFVEAGTKLLTIRHPLKKKEIIEGILKEVLDLFYAPERAKYFFSLDIQSRIDKKGARAIV
nr:hypothetical protein [Candidatus Desulfatifera sulfidica]